MKKRGRPSNPLGLVSRISLTVEILINNNNASSQTNSNRVVKQGMGSMMPVMKVDLTPERKATHTRTRESSVKKTRDSLGNNRTRESPVKIRTLESLGNNRTRESPVKIRTLESLGNNEKNTVTSPGNYRVVGETSPSVRTIVSTGNRIFEETSNRTTVSENRIFEGTPFNTGSRVFEETSNTSSRVGESSNTSERNGVSSPDSKRSFRTRKSLMNGVSDGERGNSVVTGGNSGEGDFGSINGSESLVTSHVLGLDHSGDYGNLRALSSLVTGNFTENHGDIMSRENLMALQGGVKVNERTANNVDFEQRGANNKNFEYGGVPMSGGSLVNIADYEHGGTNDGRRTLRSQNTSVRAVNGTHNAATANGNSRINNHAISSVDFKGYPGSFSLSSGGDDTSIFSNSVSGGSTDSHNGNAGSVSSNNGRSDPFTASNHFFDYTLRYPQSESHFISPESNKRKSYHSPNNGSIGSSTPNSAKKACLVSPENSSSLISPTSTINSHSFDSRKRSTFTPNYVNQRSVNSYTPTSKSNLITPDSMKNKSITANNNNLIPNSLDNLNFITSSNADLHNGRHNSNRRSSINTERLSSINEGNSDDIDGFVKPHKPKKNSNAPVYVNSNTFSTISERSPTKLLKGSSIKLKKNASFFNNEKQNSSPLSNCTLPSIHGSPGFSSYDFESNVMLSPGLGLPNNLLLPLQKFSDKPKKNVKSIENKTNEDIINGVLIKPIESGFRPPINRSVTTSGCVTKPSKPTFQRSFSSQSTFIKRPSLSKAKSKSFTSLKSDFSLNIDDSGKAVFSGSFNSDVHKTKEKVESKEEVKLVQPESIHIKQGPFSPTNIEREPFSAIHIKGPLSPIQNRLEPLSLQSNKSRLTHSNSVIGFETIDNFKLPLIHEMNTLPSPQTPKPQTPLLKDFNFSTGLTPYCGSNFGTPQFNSMMFSMMHLSPMYRSALIQSSPNGMIEDIEQGFRIDQSNKGFRIDQSPGFKNIEQGLIEQSPSFKRIQFDDYEEGNINLNDIKREEQDSSDARLALMKMIDVKDKL